MLEIRNIESTDKEWLLELFDDPDTREGFLPLDIQSVETYLQELLAKDFPGSSHLFGVAVDKQEQRVAFIQSVNRQTHVTFSLVVDKKFRGQGVGTNLIQFYTNYILERSHFNEIRAFVRTTNMASIRAFTKAGFTNTGEAPGHEAPTYRFVMRRLDENRAAYQTLQS